MAEVAEAIFCLNCKSQFEWEKKMSMKMENNTRNIALEVVWRTSFKKSPEFVRNAYIYQSNPIRYNQVITSRI